MKEVGSIIKFCWIPDHIGIKGNEKTDKIATEIIDRPIYDTKFPFSDLKPRIICQHVNFVFQDKWKNCNANKLHEINDTFFLHCRYILIIEKMMLN